MCSGGASRGGRGPLFVSRGFKFFFVLFCFSRSGRLFPLPFPAGAAPPKELKATQPLLPITIRSNATSSAPPVATLRSLRTNGEEEEVEVFEEAAAEIDGDGDAGELDAVLLLGGGRGGGISAAAEALLAAESRGGSPRSESTSRTWTASPSPSESVMFAFFFSSRVEKTLQLSPLLFIFSSFASLFSSFFERERDSRKISTSNRK